MPLCHPLNVTSCTIHNSQGSTFEAVSVGTTKGQGGHRESLYVACSRVNSLNSLFFLNKISEEEINVGLKDHPLT